MRIGRVLAILHARSGARAGLGLAVLALLAGFLWTADPGPTQATDSIAPEDIGGRIAAIEGPRYGLGTEAEKAKLASVATYIHDEFEALGLSVQEQPVTYQGETFPNVVGSLAGTVCPETSFIVGAHYDTVGGSPGADDDASGVAGMLEAARVLSSESFPATIEFVGFSFEEEGLIGSELMAMKSSAAGKDIAGVLVLDMIGYYSEEPGSQTYPDGFPPGYPDTGDFIGVIGDTASHPLLKTFVAAAASAVPDLATESLGLPRDGGSPSDNWRSDHVSFWDAGYQALLITDTAWFRNPHSHQPTDTLGTLDLDFAADVANAVVAAVIESLDDPGSVCAGVPTATPTPKDPDGDTDGDTVPNSTDEDDDNDGCPDTSEVQTAVGSESSGGRRSPHNPWDYFNPTNDGLNRVDDILSVVEHYFLTAGESGYDEKYDRTYLGPNDWNLGPPDGRILVDDILHAVKQYFHDCGEGIGKPTPTATP